MDPIGVVFGQVLVFIVGAVAALAGIAIGTRVLWRLTGRVQPREERPVTPGELRRIETAIDAMAIEVERISEAQRYTVALLSDRVAPREADRLAVPRGPGARVNTPH